ncbi:MAG: metal ABC transporter permease [Agarilytica sp.]
MISFLLHAFLVGIGIALIAGPLGSFAVWRRMSYFGDTLAHAALIGVALGLFLQVNVTLTIIFASGVIALLLVLMEKRLVLATDTLLGVLSHGALALGLVCVSLFADSRINLYAYLFGDFLTISSAEVGWIFGLLMLIAFPLFFFWKSFLMISVDEDLAKVEGKHVIRLKILLMIMIACLIALAMKIVGVMLITALLIIPAATARNFSKSPEAMAMLASIAGVLSVCFGLYSSFLWDIPAGPAVVVVALIIFVTSNLLPKHRFV